LIILYKGTYSLDNDHSLDCSFIYYQMIEYACSFGADTISFNCAPYTPVFGIPMRHTKKPKLLWASLYFLGAVLFYNVANLIISIIEMFK